MLWVSSLIFIFFCATTSGYYVVKDECPTNEEYLTCGSACPLNCTNQEPVACTRNCVAGCFCKPDFLRNKNGTCVPVEKCFDDNYQVCGENEEYNTCGSACPPTCAKPKPEACILVCREGCFCKSGYYRDESTNKCVKLNQCSVDDNYQVCGENEEYNTCGSACPPTCAIPKPEACILACREGCFCKSGYYRDERTNKCVKLDQCSVDDNYQVCGENEEYNTCGSACPPTCAIPKPEACILACREGCFCKSGYYRDERTNKCVKLDQCSVDDNYQVCGKNEEYNTCGSACPPTCAIPKPEACILACREGCFCKSGYYRDELTNKCVKLDQCSVDDNYQVCGENEEYNTCGSACPPTCAIPKPEACILVCREGCFCKSGYYRDERTNKCVKLDQCSVDNYQVCGENEEFNPCGSACPKTCCQPEPDACIQVCREGCFCKSGYCRDESTNKCVKQSKCVDKRCPKNEVYSMCNGGCQPSCNNTNPFCSEICVAGCVCPTGLLRNDVGDCVSVDMCFENWYDAH